MKLSEVAGPRDPLDFEGWIAVEKGVLWQKDLLNVWVFPSLEEAEKASHSEQMNKVFDTTFKTSYAVPVTTLNGVHLLLLVSENGRLDLTAKNNRVLAYSITHESCKAAAYKAAIKHGVNLPDPIWCYKTYNSDYEYFKEEE